MAMLAMTLAGMPTRACRTHAHRVASWAQPPSTIHIDLVNITIGILELQNCGDNAEKQQRDHAQEPDNALPAHEVDAHQARG